jgi:hypothetical protein
MRTTLDLDDDVLRAAREIARNERTTAGKVISRLARRALTERGGGERSSGVLGFRPFAPRGRVVTDHDIERLRDDGEY